MAGVCGAGRRSEERAESGPVDPFQWSHVDFNLRIRSSATSVRRAIAYATDRKEIIEKIAARLGLPAETDQQPRSRGRTRSDITHYPYDPAKAKALLDADGWKAGPDGIRVKDGQKLEFT